MKKIVTILFIVLVVNSVAKAITPHGTFAANSITLLTRDLNYFAIDTPSSQVCNVPITLTNSQNTATPDSFEQMVTVNSSLFSSLELSGLQNIEFTVGSPAPSGTVLQAWIESGNSSSSDTTIYWVNLDNNIIPANGTLKIYMNFMSASVMSATGPTGAAPDISGTYAQYDNGGFVFPVVYTRWGALSGGTLPTTTNGDAVNGGNITSISTSNYGSLSIVDSPRFTQLNFSTGTLRNSYNYPDDVYGAYYDTTPLSSYTYPTVLESKVDIGDSYSWFGTGYGQQEEGWGAIIANDNGGTGSDLYYSVRSNQALYVSNCGSGSIQVNDNTSLSETNPAVEVWSILLNNDNGTDEITNVMYDYTPVPGVTFPITIDGGGSTVYQAGCNGGPGTLFGYFGTDQNTPNPQPYEQVYWTRTRAYPPNGVMPSATVDTLTGGTSALIFPIDTSICLGVSVKLSAEGGISYTWNNNDTGSVITVNPTTTSEFIVTAKNGCGTSSDTAVITVDTAAALIIKPQDTSICAGSAVALSVPASGSDYVWSPSSTLNSSTGDNVIATPLQKTIYTAIGIDSLGCIVSGKDTIGLKQGPNVPTITQSGNDLISSATEGNQWVRNDTVIPGATNETYMFSIAGWYRVIASNPVNGCSTTSDSIYVTLTVVEQLTVESGQMAVYPNPTTGEFMIKLDGNQDGSMVEVYNVMGEKIYVTPKSPEGDFQKQTIDLSSQPDGMYFVYLKWDEGVEVGKVMVER